MVRPNARLAYILDDNSRRAVFRKRSKKLLKITGELSLKCDVKACCVVYGSDIQTPEVWPCVEEAQEVLSRFRNVPEYEQVGHRANQEDESIKMREEKLEKCRTLNHLNNMTRIMYQRMRGEGTSKARLEDLCELGSICDEKIKEIVERLEKNNHKGEGIERKLETS